VSEYVVIITVQRSARGEGDNPILALVTSESVHVSSASSEVKADKVAGIVAKLGDQVLRNLRENGLNV